MRKRIQLSDHFNYKKLLMFTVPSIVMMIFTSIYGVVDGFFVSNIVGKTPFAAVNFIVPVLMLLSAVGFMFGTGGSAIIAKTMGEGKTEKAKEYFSLFIYVSLACGIVLAIFLVTLIVRGLLIALTFKQTMSQQKMTALQPELTKIQNKYPNAATNPYDKQRMGQEQMALYKKHKINPFGIFIVMIFQFPIFISVWGAMQGSSILMSGEFSGLSLAASTGTAMMDFEGPWYVAWIIFGLMAIGQIAAMKIPQYLQKKRQAKQQKLVKNPSMEQQQKTMDMVNNIMLVMIVVMGFSLPVSMCIYWFITSLISLGQSFLTQKLISNANKKKVIRK